MGHHQENQCMHMDVLEEKKKAPESLFKEIMAENFPNLSKKMLI
jgi:hypothetical protein